MRARIITKILQKQSNDIEQGDLKADINKAREDLNKSRALFEKAQRDVLQEIKEDAKPGLWNEIERKALVNPNFNELVEAKLNLNRASAFFKESSLTPYLNKFNGKKFFLEFELGIVDLDAVSPDIKVKKGW